MDDEWIKGDAMPTNAQPFRFGRETKYPFADLDEGKAFFVPASQSAEFKRIKAAAYSFAKGHGIKFRCELMADGSLQIARDAIQPQTVGSIDDTMPLEFEIWCASLPAGQHVLADSTSMALRANIGHWVQRLATDEGMPITCEISDVSITITKV